MWPSLTQASYLNPPSLAQISPPGRELRRWVRQHSDVAADWPETCEGDVVHVQIIRCRAGDEDGACQHRRASQGP
eukprot:1195669-Prorocentrum_minimum.AAC.17